MLNENFIITLDQAYQLPEGNKVDIGYHRVTRKESLEGQSINAQEGLTIDNYKRTKSTNKLVLLSEKKAVSGEEDITKRKSFKDLMNLISTDRVKRIHIRDYDRLIRGDKSKTQLVEALQEHSVELWINGSINELDDNGELILDIKAAVDKNETRKTGKRIRVLKKYLAEQGWHNGGPAAYGYITQQMVATKIFKDLCKEHNIPYDIQECTEDEKKGYLNLNAESKRRAFNESPLSKGLHIYKPEARVVILIFYLYVFKRFGTRVITNYLRGERKQQFNWSLNEVRQVMNDCNLFTDQELTELMEQRIFLTRLDKYFHVNSVRKIINSPALAGYTFFDIKAFLAKKRYSQLERHKQEQFEGKHTPIIKREIYHQAQTIKETKNTFSKRASGGVKKPSMLNGHLFCYKCGAPIVSKSHGSGKGSYYICRNRKYHGMDKSIGGCEMPLIKTDSINQSVLSYVNEIFNKPEMIEMYLDMVNKKLEEDLPENKALYEAKKKEKENIKNELTKYTAIISSLPMDAIAKDNPINEKVMELSKQFNKIDYELDDLKSKADKEILVQLTKNELAKTMIELKDYLLNHKEDSALFMDLLEQEMGMFVLAYDKSQQEVFFNLDKTLIQRINADKNVVYVKEFWQDDVGAAPANDHAAALPGGGP